MGAARRSARRRYPDPSPLHRAVEEVGEAPAAVRVPLVDAPRVLRHPRRPTRPQGVKMRAPGGEGAVERKRPWKIIARAAGHVAGHVHFSALGGAAVGGGGGGGGAGLALGAEAAFGIVQVAVPVSEVNGCELRLCRTQPLRTRTSTPTPREKRTECATAESGRGSSDDRPPLSRAEQPPKHRSRMHLEEAVGFGRCAGRFDGRFAGRREKTDALEALGRRPRFAQTSPEAL
jgi:hypothetical protein